MKFVQHNSQPSSNLNLLPVPVKNNSLSINRNLIKDFNEKLYAKFLCAGIDESLEYFKEISNKPEYSSLLDFKLELKIFIDKLYFGKNSSEAASASLFAIRLYPQCGHFYYQYGCCMIKEGRKEKGAFYLEEAIKRDRSNFSLLSSIILKFMEIRYFSEAYEVVREYMMSYQPKVISN